jgi:hypothetical protein
LRALIEARALDGELVVDLNQSDKKGRSPSFMAAMLGHADALRTLIQAKKPDGNPAVEFNIKNSLGLSCIQIAVIKGHFDIVTLLLESGADVKITCPGFIKDMKIKIKKITPEKVAHAIWLGNEKGTEKTVTSLQHFSLWAKKKELSFGAEEVKKVIDLNYSS